MAGTTTGREKMGAGRLEAFSDGVIAVIITIMVLELKPPAGSGPTALLAEWHVFGAYALSFVLVAIYWVNHHQLLHSTRQIGTGSLWLNMHWLFWLSLYPFATAYVGVAELSPFSVALYATVGSLTSAAYTVLGYDLDKRNGVSERSLSRSRLRKSLLGVLATVIAVPMAYVSLPLALLLLIAPAVAHFLPTSAGLESDDKRASAKPPGRPKN